MSSLDALLTRLEDRPATPATPYQKPVLQLEPALCLAATHATPATPEFVDGESDCSLVAAGDPGIDLPPLTPAAESRRQTVLAMLARDGGRYAILVEDPNTDPVIMALATPDGTCELRIPEGRYDPFALVAMVDGWNTEPAPQAHPDDTLWGRVAITEPGGRTVEVDTPSGWTFAEWQAYAERYHGPGVRRDADRRASQASEHRSTSMRPYAPPARAWGASLRRSSGRSCLRRTSMTSRRAASTARRSRHMPSHSGRGERGQDGGLIAPRAGAEGSC